MVEKIVALVRGFIFELIAYIMLCYMLPGELMWAALFIFAPSVTIRNRHDFKKMLKSAFWFGFLAGSFFWAARMWIETNGEGLPLYYYMIAPPVMGLVISAIILGWSFFVYYVYRKLTD